VSGNLANGMNYQSNSAVTNGAALVFPTGVAQTSLNNDLANSLTFYLVKFAADYTMSGNPLNVAGSVVSLGNVTFNNQVKASNGALSYTGPGLSTTFGGGFVLPSAAVVDFQTEPAGSTTIGGSLDLLGQASFQGAGLATLNATLAGATGSFGVGTGNVVFLGNYTGVPLTVSELGRILGTGTVGSVTNRGVAQPGYSGAPYGTLNTGSWQSQGQSTIRISAASQFKALDAATTGTSSLLMVGGNAALDGTLDMLFDTLPSPGASYVVVSAGSLSGRFVRTKASPSSVFGDVSYTGTTATYTVSITTGIYRDGFE
jgi:hypothetical protein